jgi:hypothetical protein
MLICSFFSDIPAYLWKPEFSDILYNPTYFPGPLVCRIRQVPLYLKHESSENNHLYSIRFDWWHFLHSFCCTNFFSMIVIKFWTGSRYVSSSTSTNSLASFNKSNKVSYVWCVLLLASNNGSSSSLQKNDVKPPYFKYWKLCNCNGT